MNRAVAFIDVLGFKQKIESVSAEKLGEDYKNAITLALEKHKKFIFPDEPTFFPNRTEDDEYCDSYVFSDSIILSSYDDSEDSCLKLLVFAYRLSRLMMALGYLVRGGITYGDMFVDREAGIFVGQALTDAYQLEMRQQWAGITIDSSIPSEFPNIFNGTLHNGSLKYLFVKYPVPMKSGPIKDEYTINWRWNLTVEAGIESLLGHPQEWDAKAKLDNTLAYAKFLRANSLAFCEVNENQFLPIEMRGMSVGSGQYVKRFENGDDY